MTDAPERIWALMTPRGGLSISSDGQPLNANAEDTQVEYLRADLVPRWSSDMEAAPKDGTPILARTPQAKSRKVRIVAWLGPEANWCVHGWKDTNGTFVEPTHWMPLPASPKGETE